MIQVFENVQDSYFNEAVLTHLKASDRWQIADDYVKTGNKIDKTKYSDNGFINTSYDERIGTGTDNFLNVSAYHIYRKIMFLCGLDITKHIVSRYLWNYYNRSSTGVSHVDDYFYNKNYDYYSIIYYLTNSDGGTDIGGTVINDSEGKAVLFKSNVSHFGIGPQKSSERYLLNIMFRTSNENRT